MLTSYPCVEWQWKADYKEVFLEPGDTFYLRSTGQPQRTAIKRLNRQNIPTWRWTKDYETKCLNIKKSVNHTGNLQCTPVPPRGIRWTKLQPVSPCYIETSGIITVNSMRALKTTATAATSEQALRARLSHRVNTTKNKDTRLKLGNDVMKKPRAKNGNATPSITVGELV